MESHRASEEPHSASSRSASAPKKPARLVCALSINLLQTYNLINQHYYNSRRKSSVQHIPLEQDDKDFNLRVEIGDMLKDRYEIISVLGKGSFGQVMKCLDTHTGEEVAVKIVKSRPAFRRSGELEIAILEQIRARDPDDTHFCLRYRDSFEHKQHLCISTELLTHTLYGVIRQSGGLSLSLVRKFAFQLLHALRFLRKPEMGIVHCDLKPENVLLVAPTRPSIKLCDFGSACRTTEKIHTYIQSRYYRAPEVILGLGYSHEIDMWSLGCVLIELHTGRPLFNGRNEIAQMVKIAQLLGIPPDDMIGRSEKAHKLFIRRHATPFDASGTAQKKLRIHPAGSSAASSAAENYWEQSAEAVSRDVPFPPLPRTGAAGWTDGEYDSEDPFRLRRGLPGSWVFKDSALERVEDCAPYEIGSVLRAAQTRHAAHPKQLESFIDLVGRMLIYRPSKRITPSKALAHEFITRGFKKK